MRIRFLATLLAAACVLFAPATAAQEIGDTLEPVIPVTEVDDFQTDEDDEDEARDGESTLQPTAGKAGRRGFRYGTILEYWFLEPGEPFARMPTDPSLTGMVDDSKQLFSGAAMLRDNELKNYASRQGLLQWTSYFRVTKPGKHVFALAAKGLNNSDIRFCGAALVFNDEVKATATPDRDGSAAVDFAAPGWYKMQVRIWWSHYSSKPKFQDYSAVLKVREPGTLSLRPLGRKEIYYKAP